MSVLPLELRHASLRRGGKTVLDDISLRFNGPGFTAVMGPNGAGKTSLIRALHGLERLQDGHVLWACDESETRSHQAFVFQTPVLMRRTVEDNIAYPLRLRGLSSHIARNMALEWSERAGLKHAVGRDASTLSGGEQQKLALARALISEPQVLFLDEPTTNLDGQSTREIETLLSDARMKGLRIIMVTHNAAQAKRLADDVVFLHRGKALEHSPANAFFTNPRSDQARAYLKGDIVE